MQILDRAQGIKKKQVVETTRVSHEKNSITATEH
jgi:hypothetical protein